MDEFIARGLFTAREARLLSRISLNEKSWWNTIGNNVLEDMGYKILLYAATDKHSIGCTSEHGSTVYKTVTYRPEKIVLCERIREMAGVFIGRSSDMEIFDRGLENRSRFRKSYLLRVHGNEKLIKRGRLEEVNQLDQITSQVPSRCLSKNGLVQYVEKFYLQDPRAYDHIPLVLNHLEVPYPRKH